jgi:hypothetical protein
VALLALELLPLEGALLLVTGTQGIDIGDAPAPFWYLLGILLLAWALGRWLRQRTAGRLGLGRSFALSFLPLFASYALLARISPSVSGGVSGGLLATGGEAVGRLITALLNLFFLVMYLWYRGLALGTRPITHDDVMRHFKAGMVVLIASTALLASTPGRLQVPLVGVFSLLLPAEVFFGLLASALTRLALPRATGDAADQGDEGAWIGLAVLLAGLVVGAAIIVALAFNTQGMSTALHVLGAIGAVANRAVHGVFSGISQLLAHVFGGGGGYTGHTTQVPPRSNPEPTCTPGSCSGKSPLSFFDQLFLHLPAIYALILLGFTLVSAAFFGSALLGRLFSRRATVGGAPTDEERESLAGGALFRQQLRDLFSRGRRRSLGVEEPLASDSVRALYRDVLRAASAGGLSRATAETPDEYAVRLASLAPLDGDPSAGAQDLAVLSSACDDARYGGREPDGAVRAALRNRARRLSALLRR